MLCRRRVYDGGSNSRSSSGLPCCQNPRSTACLLGVAALAVLPVARAVPLLGFGTANIREEGPIRSAIEAGYRLIDTATLYGNHKEVAQALRSGAASRDELYLVTKVGFWPATPLDTLLKWLRAYSAGIDQFLSASKGYEAESIQAALGELGVDYIDLCLVHSPITSVSEFLLAYVPHRLGRFGLFRSAPQWLGPPLRRLLAATATALGHLGGGFDGAAASGRRARAAAWRALEEARSRGQCREIGVSNYALHLLEELESYAEEKATVHELEVHPRYQPHAVLDYCRARGIHVIGYGNGVALEDGPRGAVAEVAASTNRSASQVLLRWAVQRNVSVLPRSSRRERILENARLFDFELPLEAMAALDALDEGLPFYWDTSGLPSESGPARPEGPSQGGEL